MAVKRAAEAAEKSAGTTKEPAASTTSAAKRTTTSKSTASKAAAKKAAAKKTTTQKTAATTSATKKATTTSSARKSGVAPSSLPVREGESKWTAAELAEVRSELEQDVEQLRDELQHARSDIVDLMRDSGDGAGDDQADAGAKTYEREQEISLANNAWDMLEQTEHALERLADGSYGTCESCGRPIGKARLQAAPRATLCIPCKTQQERH